MVETAGILCPERKDKFEKISLSRRTLTRRVELIDEDISSSLNRKTESFTLYSLALDESKDVKATAQLLIFKKILLAFECIYCITCYCVCVIKCLQAVCAE